MTKQSMHRRPSVGGDERDTFTRVSRKPGHRRNPAVKRAARRRERHVTRQEMRQLAA